MERGQGSEDPQQVEKAPDAQSSVPRSPKPSATHRRLRSLSLDSLLPPRLELLAMRRPLAAKKIPRSPCHARAPGSQGMPRSAAATEGPAARHPAPATWSPKRRPRVATDPGGRSSGVAVKALEMRRAPTAADLDEKSSLKAQKARERRSRGRKAAAPCERGRKRLGIQGDRNSLRTTPGTNSVASELS